MDNRLLPDYEQHLPLFSGIVQDRLNRIPGEMLLQHLQPGPACPRDYWKGYNTLK